MNGAPDMMVAGLKMMGSLGIVLAILFSLLIAMRRLAGRRIGVANGNRIQVLESQYVGVKKSISLVRVPGKVLVVGVTPDRIQLLDTLTDDFQIENGESVSAVPFGSVLLDKLAKAKNRSRKEKNG